MRIKASEIQPGMVINMATDKLDPEIYLVLSLTGIVDVEIGFLSYQDNDGQLYYMTINGTQKVEVVTGDQRKYAIEKIKDGAFKQLHYVEEIINSIRLIEGMEKIMLDKVTK